MVMPMPGVPDSWDWRQRFKTLDNGGNGGDVVALVGLNELVDPIAQTAGARITKHGISQIPEHRQAR